MMKCARSDDIVDDDTCIMYIYSIRSKGAGQELQLQMYIYSIYDQKMHIVYRKGGH